MKPIQSVTDTELSVLKLLWEHGPLTSRQLVDQLYPNGTASDVGTIHSMLQRLEKKKIVVRDRNQHPHLFRANVSQAEMAGTQLRNLADKLSDGSLFPLLTHLVESKSLSANELDSLRKLIDEQKKKSAPLRKRP
ncbi:MAG: BlaI/MecI/CopY family transcriptional regulator [Pirellula sp.]